MTQSPVPMGLKPIEVNAVYALGECEQCLLIVWRQQPSKEAFERRDVALVDLTTRFPERCAYLEVIETESKPPPGNLRKRAVEVFPKLGKNLTCVGACVDGPQLRSAFVRAILAGMMFLIPQFPPAKVFKRVSDMIEWAQLRIGVDADSKRMIIEALDYLRKVSSPA